MKILVTGGAGFIGSHLCESLINAGHNVIVLDNMSNANLSNIVGLLNSRKFRLVTGDIRDYALVRDITKGVDVIFHLAAQIHVDRSIIYPEVTFNINTVGTLNILQAARENSVQRTIYASTSEVYGSALSNRINEDHPLNPASPYASSKVAGDRLCFSYFYTYGMNVTIVRNFNTYGPRQRATGYASAIPKFIKRVMSDKSPIVYGDGDQTRDYLYVEDAVSAYLSVLANNDLAGEAINFGTGSEIRIKDLASLVIRKCGKDNRLKVVFSSARPGEVMRLCADISKAQKQLKWSPKYSIEQGITKFVKLYSELDDQWVDDTSRFGLNPNM